MLGYVRRKIKKIALFLILILCGYLIQKLWTRHHHEGLPVLLWWSPMFVGHSQIINCDSLSCLLTKDRHYQNQQLAYLFYGSNFNISDLPVWKNNQIWALFHEESPRNQAVFVSNQIWELFDITSTFSRYSDFPLTLHYLKDFNVLLDRTYFVEVDEKNLLLNQIAPVLYIQSDCDTPNDRDDYVRELMGFIQIDSYGTCLNNQKFPRSFSDVDPLDVYNEKFLKFIGQYKFIIAFENAICDDYITEKLWRPLIVGSIPIYLGSPTIEDWLPNQQSAILVKDFNTPQQLADYIHKLNENDQLYNNFLLHKRQQIITNRHLIEMLNNQPFHMLADDYHPIPAFQCYVCRQLHNGIKRKQQNSSVYKCQPPRSDNSWTYYWKVGQCQGKSLLDSIRNGNRYNDEACRYL